MARTPLRAAFRRSWSNPTQSSLQGDGQIAGEDSGKGLEHHAATAHSLDGRYQLQPSRYLRAFSSVVGGQPTSDSHRAPTCLMSDRPAFTTWQRQITSATWSRKSSLLPYEWILSATVTTGSINGDGNTSEPPHEIMLVGITKFAVAP
jgi:hypothetical protein